MAHNEIVGQCVCPLCKRGGANVLKGAGGKFYINCDACCSLLRSLSREGSEIMHALIPAANERSAEPAAAEVKAEPAAVEPAAAKPKRRGSFADALATLGGRGGNG